MATSTQDGGERTFVARQLILDERHQVFAYELLCRDAGLVLDGFRVDGPGTALQPFAGFAKIDVAAVEPALVAALNKPHVTLGAIEELLKRDPRLSLRVLRCVNSAGFGLRREVHSIREALLLLGLHQVRKWASVWALAGVNGGSPELVSLTVLRARCCELLGARLNVPDGGAEYFLLGLCSLLDVVADRPMEEAVKELPLTQDTRDALLGRENAARHVLDAVMLHERGDWDAATEAAAGVGLDAEALPEAYHQALSWARQVTAAAAA